MQHAAALLALGHVSVWKTVQFRLYWNSDVNTLFVHIFDCMIQKNWAAESSGHLVDISPVL